MFSLSEFKKNLFTNTLQLRQVEAALTVDPSNAELLQLKCDLEKVITLTQEVVGEKTDCDKQDSPDVRRDRDHVVSQTSALQKTGRADGCGGGRGDVIAARITSKPCKKTWAVGDRCLAPSSDDGQYHEATVEDMTEDLEEVSVVFDHSRLVEATRPELLRILSRDQPQPANLPARKNRGLEGERRRRHKRLQFYRRLEEKREADKHRWQAFLHCNQAVKKTTMKSIFASPQTHAGRVGIGTCGQSGRPMTEFRTCEKPLKKQ